jgi:polyisoprenoid-binding protein YceI
VSFRTAIRRPRTWLIAIPIAVLLVGVVGPWVYINFIKDDPPERLSFDDVPSDTSSTQSGESARDSIEGSWSVAAGSQAGYRVKEILFGQDTEAVGRTQAVTGTLAIDGTTVTTAEFTVDLTTVTSDESRRDNQFQGRIMDTATFPTATFVLTQPIELDAVPANLEEITAPAVGDLMLRGVTHEVTFDVVARRDGAQFQVDASIPIVFDDYDIPEPSFGPAQVGDDGEIEVLLLFE